MKLVSPVGHPGANASSERRSFKSTQAARRVFTPNGYYPVFTYPCPEVFLVTLPS